MAALTRDLDAAKKSNGRLIAGPVAAAVRIYAGALVCRNAAGYFVPASDTSGLSAVVGRATAQANNLSGGNGAITLVVEVGVFAYTPSAGLIAAAIATLGKAVEVIDDQTLGLPADAGTTNNIGGTTFLDEITPEGLYFFRVGV